MGTLYVPTALIFAARDAIQRTVCRPSGAFTSFRPYPTAYPFDSAQGLRRRGLSSVTPPALQAPEGRKTIAHGVSRGVHRRKRESPVTATEIPPHDSKKRCVPRAHAPYHRPHSNSWTTNAFRRIDGRGQRHADSESDRSADEPVFPSSTSCFRSLPEE